MACDDEVMVHFWTGFINLSWKVNEKRLPYYPLMRVNKTDDT